MIQGPCRAGPRPWKMPEIRELPQSWCQVSQKFGSITGPPAPPPSILYGLSGLISRHRFSFSSPKSSRLISEDQGLVLYYHISWTSGNKLSTSTSTSSFSCRATVVKCGLSSSQHVCSMSRSLLLWLYVRPCDVRLMEPLWISVTVCIVCIFLLSNSIRDERRAACISLIPGRWSSTTPALILPCNLFWWRGGWGAVHQGTVKPPSALNTTPRPIKQHPAKLSVTWSGGCSIRSNARWVLI